MYKNCSRHELLVDHNIKVTFSFLGERKILAQQTASRRTPPAGSSAAYCKALEANLQPGFERSGDGGAGRGGTTELFSTNPMTRLPV